MSDAPRGYSFPIARKALAFGHRARANWLLRHQNPLNFWIHMLGIPLAMASMPLLLIAPWEWAAAAFVGGYFLQWLGHKVEGNDVGELIPIKRALGMKTISVGPQYAAK